MSASALTPAPGNMRIGTLMASRRSGHLTALWTDVFDVCGVFSGAWSGWGACCGSGWHVRQEPVSTALGDGKGHAGVTKARPRTEFVRAVQPLVPAAVDRKRSNKPIDSNVFEPSGKLFSRFGMRLAVLGAVTGRTARRFEPTDLKSCEEEHSEGDTK